MEGLYISYQRWLNCNSFVMGKINWLLRFFLFVGSGCVQCFNSFWEVMDDNSINLFQWKKIGEHIIRWNNFVYR